VFLLYCLFSPSCGWSTQPPVFCDFCPPKPCGRKLMEEMHHVFFVVSFPLIGAPAVFVFPPPSRGMAEEESSFFIFLLPPHPISAVKRRKSVPTLCFRTHLLRPIPLRCIPKEWRMSSHTLFFFPFLYSGPLIEKGDLPFLSEARMTSPERPAAVSFLRFL